MPDSDSTLKNDQDVGQDVVEAESVGDSEPQLTDDDADHAEIKEEPNPALLKWTESTGAFVLDVLSPDDTGHAAAEYATSSLLQQELADLLPVADILTSLYQQPTSQVPNAEPDIASPDRARAPQAPPTTMRSEVQSRTRIRPAQVSGTRSPAKMLRGEPAMNLLTAALAIVVALSVLWALALSDRIGSRDDEIAALNRQIAELRTGSNASAYVLFPTADGGTAKGTVYYSPANSSVLLDVSGLPELSENRVYQIWLQRTGTTSWDQGPTFLVNRQGESVQRLAGDTPTFIQIAISEEPMPGSPEPTGPFLVTGTLAAANG